MAPPWSRFFERRGLGVVPMRVGIRLQDDIAQGDCCRVPRDVAQQRERATSAICAVLAGRKGDGRPIVARGPDTEAKELESAP